MSDACTAYTAQIKADWIGKTVALLRHISIRLLHSPSNGVRYEGALFLDGDKVTTASTLPALVVGAENNDQALVVSQIQDATKGTRFRLENLKGRNLKSIGFTDKTIHFSQQALFYVK